MIGHELGRIEKNVLVEHAVLFDVGVEQELVLAHVEFFALQVEAVD